MGSSSVSLALILVASAFVDHTSAQDTSTEATNAMTSATPSPTTPMEAGKASDTAPGASDEADDGETNGTGLVNYYFVFLALIVCIAGLAAFMVWRKRRRAAFHFHRGGQSVMTRDISQWYPGPGRAGPRRYRQPREWDSRENNSREEGLNEFGEAPPAYAPPKTREEEEQATGNYGGPAVPMQTLSRQDAGLKPPDYTQATTQSVEGNAGLSRASSSARPDHPETGTQEGTSRT
ncbi:hypothetical protein KC363_g2076 [Hortaea werneckii]|uniref:Uncharacterized protein n=1 Tax=Hortaea werneckii TaxID=91943 RepID=A0A3M7F4R0_HORWE|nr:hypothetical protein KC361_g3899 [Hortaea werneckii]KAI6885879.1 hypothetical protein KC325_g3284 [Hortaea werneckii]KAI6997923.1 hypothetical protein KC359_g2741 [Hortaea werneckii]KAI7084022.1 hypothetical protein KC356_g7083 [Hortaea werneckii]KAI7148850.1 hypothetical protein KC344_g1620 [Hortaea werneckii]